jgi:tetratricopeptide (TPR) repeat protein
MTLLRLVIAMLLVRGVTQPQLSPLPVDKLEKVRAVLDAIYRLDYEKAKTQARAMIAESPEDPTGHVYLARIYWQEFLLEERALTVQRFTQPDFFSEVPRYKVALDPAAQQVFQQLSDTAVSKAKELLKKSPRDPAGLFLLGVAHQTNASFELTLNNAWFAAMRAGNHSFHAHRDLLAVDSRYADARLVTGVSSYTVGRLPWKLKWLAVLLGYQGTAERGKRDLETAVAKATIVADDARTMLALIYVMEKRYDAALVKLKELRARYPENYLTHLDIAGLQLRRRQPAEAVALYKEALEKIDARTGSYVRLERAIVYNQLGVAHRMLKDYPAAESWFLRTVNGKDVNERSRTVARLELGKTWDLMGRRAEAVELYKLVQAAPDYGGSRREASRWAGQPYKTQ